MSIFVTLWEIASGEEQSALAMTININTSALQYNAVSQDARAQ